MSTQWSENHHLPYCAICCEFVCESMTRYTCPSCDDAVYEGKRFAPVVPQQRYPGWPWRVAGAVAS